MGDMPVDGLGEWGMGKGIGIGIGAFWELGPDAGMPRPRTEEQGARRRRPPLPTRKTKHFPRPEPPQ